MNLLSVQGWGACYLVIIFLLCVLLVHLFKLAKIGYRTVGKKLPPTPPNVEEDKPEPVYYIVERKQKKKGAEYSTPKPFRFQS